MGESQPNQATTPDCQSLTEQPTKYLQTMGNLPDSSLLIEGTKRSGQPIGGRLATSHRTLQKHSDRLLCTASKVTTGGRGASGCGC